MIKVEVQAKLRELQDLVELHRFNPGSEFYIERFRNDRGKFSEGMLAEVGVKHHGTRLAKVMVEREQIEPMCALRNCVSVSLEELLAQINENLDDEMYHARQTQRADYGDW